MNIGNKNFLVLSVSVFLGLSQGVNANPCQDLSVIIVNMTQNLCTLTGQNLAFGYLINNTHIPAFIPPGTGTVPFELTQGAFSGPALTLDYECGAGKKISFYTKQNYCQLQAGDINGRVLLKQHMQAEYIAKTGSFFWGIHGNISWGLMDEEGFK